MKTSDQELIAQYGGYSDEELRQALDGGVPEWQAEQLTRLLELRGAARSPLPPRPAKKKLSTLAWLSPTLVILGFVIAGKGLLAWFLGVIMIVSAVVIGHIARRRIRAEAATLRGRRVALAGLIAGYGLLGFLVLALGMSQLGNAAKRERAETELAALTAALESYKADFSGYPLSQASQSLTPDSDMSVVSASAAHLYRCLSGYGGTEKVYFEFPPSMLTSAQGTTALCDPWGNFYRYSTSFHSPYKGEYPAIWSTAGNASPDRWITNW